MHRRVRVSPTGITLLVALVAAAAVCAIRPLAAASSTVVISEFRTRGPAGGNDEFVEVYNASAQPVDISGWKLAGSSNTTPTGTRATVPAGTILGAGCHFLFANTSPAGYSGAAAPDLGYAAGVADTGGVAILDGASAIVDRVGVTTTGSGFREGAPLSTPLSSNTDRSYQRKPGGAAGNGTDTDDNASDFTLIGTGAPQPATNPENRTSPCVAVVPPSPGGTGSQTIVISQIFGGGGNSGSPFRSDYIELFNRSTASVPLSGWSVQYLPPSGSGSWKVTPLSGAIAPGAHYLVQEAQGAGGSATLPTADATGTISMSAVNGHVALVSTAAALPANTCQGLANLVDFAGYGTAACREGTAAAPAGSATRALFRIQSGCIDTDDNAADLDTGSPSPRNSQAMPHPCVPISAPQLSINQIQGNGTASPHAGEAITTSGIVTGLRSTGFFLQNADADADADPQTSEGIFVFTGAAPGRAAGELVTVVGTVQEFVPPSDPASPSITEITGPSVTLMSAGHALPSPVAVTPGSTTPGGGLNQLERFEGMRISIASLTVVAATTGFISEPNATGSTNGIFYGVLPGLARPMREPGVDGLDTLPAGSPANVPRFDGNPERIRVDSDAQPGAVAIAVTAGATVTGLVGPLDYGARAYTLLPDPASPPTVAGNVSAAAVSPPAGDEFTVASFNLERFFDTVNDPSSSDTVLTPAAFDNRLNKASLAIRNVMRAPDVIGVEEMENLTTLQALAAKVNADAVAAGGASPQYTAFLEEGNDVGGIDVGFLVRQDRITVHEVTQFGKDATYTNPNNMQTELLNDRPSLLARVTVTVPGRGPQDVTVIVNHLRSLSGVNDPVDGHRIRTKRRAQAEFLAGFVQQLQTASPAERLVLVGDFNAFELSDGYVDVMGTILGTPAPADQVVLATSDLVNPNLTDLVSTAAAAQRYSFVFDGNAQELDHVIVNSAALPMVRRLEYARNNADFPETFRSDANRPERISDHDMLVAYFSTPPLVGASMPVGGVYAGVVQWLSGALVQY